MKGYIKSKQLWRSIKPFCTFDKVTLIKLWVIMIEQLIAWKTIKNSFMQTNQKVQQESTMNFLKPIVRYVFQPVMNLKIKLSIAIFAAQVFIKVAMELLQ